MEKQQFKSFDVIRFKRFTRKSYSVFASMNKAITIGVLSGFTLASAHATSVNPTEKTNITTSVDSIAHKELEEVEVTATKIGLPMEMAAKQVTVVGRKEIEQAPVKSVQDLLNYVAGVDLQQRSPHGVQADVSLRGGSADQVAILLNGVNLTNPQTGHYSLDIPINLSDIERIEIVQGPTSLAYGASALSGGINIITRRDTTSNLFCRLEGGMYGIFGAEARGAYKGESASVSVSASYGRSDGYIRNSDYNIINTLLHSRLSVSDVADISIQMGYNGKKYGANTFYTPSYPDQYDDTKSIFTSISGQTYGRLKLIPQMYWSRHYDCFQLIREGTPDVPTWYTDHNYHRSDVFGISLNTQYMWALGITGFGGEIRNEGILSSVLGEKMKDTIGKYTKSYGRTNINYFVEHNIVFDKITISAGGILNHNTAIVNKMAFYPSVNISYRPVDKLNIYASWNTATRMPTFTEMYYTTRTHVGNPKLLSEYTRSIECGARLNGRWMNISGLFFVSEGENLIDWMYNDSDKKWYSTNIKQGSLLRTLGASINTSIGFKQLIGSNQPIESLQIGYQYLTQNSTDASETNPISRYVFNYLKHKLTATLKHDIVKNMSMVWKCRWQDREGVYTQYVDLKENGVVAYRPFFILDLRVEYKLSGFDLFVNANNIFNTRYVDFGNIPQSGFWLSAGASYSFN